MADWPDVDELKKVLNVSEEGDWDLTLGRVLASAIAKVKADVGTWDDEVDEPDDSLAQAALRMAELLSLRPEAAVGAVADPTYQRLLFGHRRRFAFS